MDAYNFRANESKASSLKLCRVQPKISLEE